MRFLLFNLSSNPAIDRPDGRANRAEAARLIHTRQAKFISKNKLQRTFLTAAERAGPVSLVPNTAPGYAAAHAGERRTWRILPSGFVYVHQWVSA